MARWGKCDFRELKDLQKRMEQLQKEDFQAFCEAAAKELAARLLAKVIKRTPVGQYEASTGKIGGIFVNRIHSIYKNIFWGII